MKGIKILGQRESPPAQTQWPGPTKIRCEGGQAGDRLTVPGNNDVLPSRSLVNEAGKMGLGLINTDGVHGVLR